MAAKPSIPKGTRDFSPVEMAKRNYIFNTIRDVYHLYGFQQIETPSMEMLSTLMGKYGDEGDKLLFKIQNSGDYFSGITDEELLSRNAVKLASKFCEKGLRYDLTVPFARYVVMHRDEITFPFKRYQIQPVWRADRPQKGRYREFYQCDADVVGSDSLLNEVELMQIVDTVFSRFNIRVCIKINNRKILSGIAEIIGESDKIVDITVAIDKLDKIGLDNVNAELKEKGISDEAIAKLQPIILLSGTNAEKLATLKNVLSASEVGLKGVEESEFILNTLETMGLKNEIELDQTLAYVAEHSDRKPVVYTADEDAVYEKKYVIDLSEIKSTVAFPHLPGNTRTIDEVGEVKIDQVVIGSCTNGFYKDIEEAASIIRGKKVAKNVRAIIIPATQSIYLKAMENGLLKDFIEAGCVVSTPTCGPCLGGHMGILAAGERAVSTTNRNFVGRMGHPESEVYLASPAVAAASAIAGKIVSPKEVL